MTKSFDIVYIFLKQWSINFVKYLTMKVAVFIRGHKRTWNYTKEHLFDFFENSFGDVDYYVAFWKSQKNYNTQDIENDFIGRNLKKHLLVENHYNFDNFTGPCYLSNLLTPFRIKQELLSGSKYDYIFDTRPDAAYKKIANTYFYKSDEIGCTRVSHEMVGIWQGMCDIGFMTTPSTHILWNQRTHWNENAWLDIPRSGVHSLMYDYALHNNLIPIEFSWCYHKIIRPDVIDYSIDSQFEGIYQRPWGILSLAEKIDYIKKSNLGMDEYLYQLTT